MNKKKPSLSRSLKTALMVIGVIIAFAYGVKVTDVNFETTRSPVRLTQLKRVIRALVKPDVVEYETEETTIQIPFYLPCPEDQEIEVPEPDTSGPYLTASQYCGPAKGTVIIEGHNFIPRNRGPINFFTASGVNLQLGNYLADDNGDFQMEIELPNRQPVAEAQYITATVRVPVGSPQLTETAITTWDKIVETVFMALLATAIGTALAIPVSFFAARNLMSVVRSPLSSVSLSLIGWPLGIYLGLRASGILRGLLAPLLANLLYSLIGLALAGLVVFLFVKLALSSS